MSAQLEFLPDAELTKFIAMHVVGPQVEAFRDRGHPVKAETVFVTQNQRKKGPKLGAVGRAVRVNVEIRCWSQVAIVAQVLCRCRLRQELARFDEPFEWDLTTEVRRDDKGFYATGTLVSAKIDQED